MTYQQTNNARVKSGCPVIFFFFFGLCLFSCSKKNDNANALFIGTYQGNDCSGNLIPDVVITAGDNGSAIDITFAIGTGACENNIILVGDVVSVKQVVFPSQTFNDLCGNAITVSGNATLNVNTLTLDISGLTALSGSTTKDTSIYCFSGVKVK